jgi:hypothetical protein
MTITTILVIFGLALLFWAITSTGSHPARRTVAASTGLFALLIAALLGTSQDHDHDGPWGRS